jgi:protein involved in polysaccharide export with SLBB domain
MLLRFPESRVLASLLLSLLLVSLTALVFAQEFPVVPTEEIPVQVSPSPSPATLPGPSPSPTSPRVRVNEAIPPGLTPTTPGTPASDAEMTTPQPNSIRTFMPPTLAPAPPPESNPETWQKVHTIEALERAQEVRSTRSLSRLDRFGEVFFVRSREDFTSYTDAVIPDDYRLAPGDELLVTTYNVNGGESITQLTMDQNGEVVLPGAGPVSLNGLTQKQAQVALEQQLRARLPNLRVKLGMTHVRKIRIFLIGDMKKPGAFLVNPGSTVMDAMLLGAGPNDAGSYRRVQLQRGGVVVATFDLYDFLLNGKVNSPRVMEGDRIFVPVAGPQVAISGPVYRPAIFELKNEKTLAQLLKLAGGVRPDAYAKVIQLERVVDNNQRSIFDIPLDQAPRFRIRAGDFFLVQEVLDDLSNGVYLDGAVRRPGWYSLGGRLKVSDLLRKAQGMKEGAFPGHAEIYRIDSPDKPIRVIGFELDLALRGDPRFDLALQPKDRVVVYDTNTATYNRERVRIQGEVSRPGEYTRFAEMRVRDLLYQAGGLTPEASGQAEIARRTPVGIQIIPIDLDRVLLSPDVPDNVALGDLDVLLVRKSLRSRLWPGSITLGGEVVRPGVYAVDPQKDTLRSVIERAGGLTDQAYAPGAVFVRNKTELVLPEREKLTELIFVNTEYIARQISAVEAEAANATAASLRMSAANAALTEKGLDFIPRIINRIIASNRIPLDLEAIMASGASDPGVRDGDILLVPSAPTTVLVAGAVNMPAAFVFKPGLRPRDYIATAGGRSKDAEEDETFIMRVNGDMLNAEHVDQLLPGDVILVPPAAIVAEPGAWERFLQVFQVAVGGIALYRLIDR